MVKKKATVSTTTPPHSAAPSEPPQPRQIALPRRARPARAPTQAIGQTRAAGAGRGGGRPGGGGAGGAGVVRGAAPGAEGPRPVCSSPIRRAHHAGRRTPCVGVLLRGARVPTGGAASVLTQGPIRQPPGQPRQRPESPIARAITSFMISLVPP